ncbi:hypothetical protein BJY00DRAFT_315418 [Aspergillus carlsbadensis]|nr:hypothetical protein BJY00DRAFT_315418 [Aspergillus carlsbadensis]
MLPLLFLSALPAASAAPASTSTSHSIAWKPCTVPNFPALAALPGVSGFLDQLPNATTLDCGNLTVPYQFFKWCAGEATEEECPLKSLDEDLPTLFDDLIAAATESPIDAAGCTLDDGSTVCRSPVSGEDILFSTQGLFVYESTWPTLAQSLNAKLAGDRQLAKYIAPHTQGVSQSYQYQVACITWPAPLSNPPHKLNASAMTLAPLILLINAFHDPGTSYTWAAGMLEQIPSRVLLARSGNGHTSYGLFRGVSDRIYAFLVNGTLLELNTVLDE